MDKLEKITIQDLPLEVLLLNIAHWQRVKSWSGKPVNLRKPHATSILCQHIQQTVIDQHGLMKMCDDSPKPFLFEGCLVCPMYPDYCNGWLNGSPVMWPYWEEHESDPKKARSEWKKTVGKWLKQLKNEAWSRFGGMG